MRIRSARVGDAARIAAVRAASWKAAYTGIVPDRVLHSMDESRATAFWTDTLGTPRTRRQPTLVAELDDEVVGFVAGGPSRDAGDAPASVAEIYTLYLLPRAWRKGIGTALLGDLVDRLARAGFRDATLWVLEANARGRGFYAARGFGADGGVRTVTIGTPLAEIRYRRRLAPARESVRGATRTEAPPAHGS